MLCLIVLLQFKRFVVEGLNQNLAYTLYGLKE